MRRDPGRERPDRASPSAAARPGWRTAWTGPSRGSIPTTNSVAAVDPDRERPEGRRRRRGRRLGEQPVRRHARADRSAGRTRWRSGSASATGRREWRSSAARCWSAVRQSGAGHRGGTLQGADEPIAVDSIDTAVAYDTTSWPILRMTNDGLVAYNQASGVAGTQLVPDLAVSLPTPTDGGRTYTFRLRPNIRYSNGRPVKASDFRAALERDFEIGKRPVALLRRHRRRRPLQEASEALRPLARDRRGRRRARRSPSISSRRTPSSCTSSRSTSPTCCPRGQPAKEARTRPLPATGPYMIASYRPRHTLRLVRNPHFREWSKAAQPDGYPDEIVFEIGGTPAAAVNDVIHGKADVFSTASIGDAPLVRELLDDAQAPVREPGAREPAAARRSRSSSTRASRPSTASTCAGP